jgi:hypothetical protein
MYFARSEQPESKFLEGYMASAKADACESACTKESIYLSQVATEPRKYADEYGANVASGHYIVKVEN